MSTKTTQSPTTEKILVFLQLAFAPSIFQLGKHSLAKSYPVPFHWLNIPLISFNQPPPPVSFNREHILWYLSTEHHWVSRQWVVVCVCALVTQLCPTLCDPMDCRPLGSFVHVILQARILQWVSISCSTMSGYAPVYFNSPNQYLSTGKTQATCSTTK